jgi:hypothetical protein
MNNPSTFKKVLPLVTIFLIIILLTLGTAYAQDNMGTNHLMMLLMGYFFLIFGGFKIMNLKRFVEAYSMYDIVAMKSKAYAFLYPFIEAGLGILYLTHSGGIHRDVFAFLLMTVSTYGVWKALQKKDEIPCACLGMVFKVPMTKVTLFENLFMAIMAIYMIITNLISGNMLT